MQLRTLALGSLSAVIAPLALAQTYTISYSFKNGPDGSAPAASLIRDADGNLYGTTIGGGFLGRGVCISGGCGVVFRLDPSGNESVLHTFNGHPGEGMPGAALLRDAAGNLYGTMQSGGAYGLG